jgi:hypothetical protein
MNPILSGTAKWSSDIDNVVLFGDTHCGCQLALYPPEGVVLDHGGSYTASAFQRKLWAVWEEFWAWIDEAVDGAPFAAVHLGDALDGVHHNSTSQITHNLTDQARIARVVLGPVVAHCKGRYYHLRGTEAHVGDSGQQEERLASELGAIPTGSGQYARFELWKRVGPRLIHCLHHIGVTGSQAYESTAPHKELVEAYAEAGRWHLPAPDLIVRGHRHRLIETGIPTANGEGRSIVVPGWQGKTPYTYRIPGARQAQPQFGGVLVRWSEQHEELFVRSWVRSLTRPDPE